MSDSIPKPASAADESLAPGLPPSAASPRWWIASLAFHGVLLAWLVFFSPVRVFDPNAKPAARQVSADRAREVVEQIRETQADSLEQNLRSLEDIRGKIAELENRKRTEFAAFAREMGKDAPAKAAAEQQTIAQAQAEALAAIDKAGENAAHFSTQSHGDRCQCLWWSHFQQVDPFRVDRGGAADWSYLPRLHRVSATLLHIGDRVRQPRVHESN